MIGRITSGKDISGIIFYNETKVKKGDAELLFSRNSPIAETTAEKIFVLNQRISLSQRIENPTFHASLSFAHEDKEKLDEGMLKAITLRYMDEMGYGKQPYYVYQHFDTAHPHIHIATVRVGSDGKKINDSYERIKSNKIRQAIEKDFGITIAEGRNQEVLVEKTLPINAEIGNLKGQISTIVRSVFEEYSFSSLAQYNSVLEQFGIKAVDVSGKTAKGDFQGLVYSMIDKNGERIGKAIPASAIYGKPTLANLQNIVFIKGKKNKEKYQEATKKIVAEMLQKSFTKENFAQKLKEKHIETIFHKAKNDNIFGLTFIDNQRKVVFSGSKLGSEFTAKKMLEKLIPQINL